MKIPYSYDENGNIEVLVHKDYGNGWATDANCLAIALDKRIIDFYKEESKGKTIYDNAPFREMMKSWGYDDIITSNLFADDLLDCSIVTLKPGTMFYMTNYDGCESISIVDEYQNIWKLPE